MPDGNAPRATTATAICGAPPTRRFATFGNPIRIGRLASPPALCPYPRRYLAPLAPRRWGNGAAVAAGVANLARPSAPTTQTVKAVPSSTTITPNARAVRSSLTTAFSPCQPCRHFANANAIPSDRDHPAANASTRPTANCSTATPPVAP